MIGHVIPGNGWLEKPLVYIKANGIGPRDRNPLFRVAAWLTATKHFLNSHNVTFLNSPNMPYSFNIFCTKEEWLLLILSHGDETSFIRFLNEEEMIDAGELKRNIH